MEGGIHAKGGLGGAGSTGLIRGLSMLGLSGLLKSIEIGDADAASLAWVQGAVHEGGVCHVCGWRRALVPRETRAARFPLALLTGRTSQAGEIGMISKH